ncbi:dihydrofolate reductase family protein [Microbacterium chocolatum]|uniref:dihydrofolate reductase family protein n=1 Tax=Microbacterium aurantiacum TaxID=162393 RepID=UPI00338DC22A
MTRVRLDLFASLDGYTAALGPTEDDPTGEDWGRLTAAYAATRTFRARVLGDSSGAGTTGVDDRYAAAAVEGVGSEVMGAAMFGLHAHPDDPDWRGWWGDEPPFGYPVFVLTRTAPRPSLRMAGGTTFHFRSGEVHDVVDEARTAAAGSDVRVGGGIRTAHAALKAGLVDDLHVMVAPVVLGRGIRVWDGLDGLEQAYEMTSEVAESGVIHIVFRR